MNVVVPDHPFTSAEATTVDVPAGLREESRATASTDGASASIASLQAAVVVPAVVAPLLPISMVCLQPNHRDERRAADSPQISPNADSSTLRRLGTKL